MALTVFDDKERTRIGPMKPGEGEFAFYDSSARNPYVVYRALVNEWLSKLPASEQPEMVKRLRTGTNPQYQAALAELVIHTALLQLGHVVEIHPACPHPSRRPDFLVKDASGKALVYVEVTTFGPDVETVSGDNREAAIYNALDTVNLPAGWLLGYSVEERGTGSPSLAKLKKDVEAWAAGACGDDPAQMPRKVFEADDWRIELTLHGGFKKDVVYERKIGAASTGVRSVAPHIDLRQALDLKGRRYRIEETPYLIVVADCKDSIPTGDAVDDALVDALFGTPAVVFRCFADGRTEEEETRKNDGFFGRHGEPRNRNVSGVLLLPEPNLWKLRDKRWQPLIADNPFATNPLPKGLLPLPGYTYVEEEDKFGRAEGTILADILGLPQPWPPAD